MTKTIEVRPGLSVEIGPLTIKESYSADKILGTIAGDEPTMASLMQLTTKVYTICAIRKINNIPVSPLGGGLAYDSVEERFTLKELTILGGEYSKIEGIEPDDLKNESAAAGSAT